jgi:hypothetical protein
MPPCASITRSRSSLMLIVPFCQIPRGLMIRAGCPGGDEAGQSVTLMIRVIRRQALYALKEF